MQVLFEQGSRTIERIRSRQEEAEKNRKRKEGSKQSAIER